MREKLLLKRVVVLSIFAISSMVWGQNSWSYDFGTGTDTADNANAATGKTDFFPDTPTNGGTYRVRIGAEGGDLKLVNPGTGLGTGSQVQLKSATGTDTNKFGVYDWSTPAKTLYFKVHVGSAFPAKGTQNFSIGVNTVANDNNGFTTHYNNSLASIKILFNGGSVVPAITRRFAGSDILITANPADITNKVWEVYGNNASTATTYTRDATNYTLNAQSWDMYIGGVKYSPANGWPTAGTLAANTNLSGFAYFVESSPAASPLPANSSVLYIDDLEYSTVLTKTTWNGALWSNGTPDATKNAVIASDYTGSSFESKSLTINVGKTLTVPSTGFVKAENVTNNGNIIVANNANFVQTGTFTAGESSTFKVNRTTKPVVRLDYNSWSSPMFTSTQNLLDFSPGTLLSRFLTYNNNKFEAVTSPATTKFTPGAGYLIRTSNTYTTTPTPFDGQFVGTVPNSGDVTYTPSIGGNYVFLGNPYPSAISMEDFYNVNSAQMQTATFYIWNSESKMNTSNVYVNPYITQTIVGPNPLGPAYYVPVGQGFLIDRGSRTTSSFLFTNSMRRTDQTGTFAKTAVADRFWLQMTSPAGLKPQLLVGFTPNATSGFDAGYDGKLLESNGDVIYSTVDNKSLVITALGTFSSTDVINVTANFASAGNYTFDIAQKEGVFENGQQIYLKDNVTGIETELSSANYTFAATAGLQADRFTVSFSKGVLASSNATKAQSTIYADHQVIHVKGASKIASVEVYDMSGKLVKTTKNVYSENTSLAVAYKGVAVVKLVLENGEVVTKKVILK